MVDCLGRIFDGEVSLRGQVKDHRTPVTYVVFIIRCRRWPVGTGEATNTFVFFREKTAVLYLEEWDCGTSTIAPRMEIYAHPSVSGASIEEISFECLPVSSFAYDFLQESDLFRVHGAQGLIENLHRCNLEWLGRWRLWWDDHRRRKLRKRFLLIPDFVGELLHFRLVFFNSVFEIFGSLILELFHFY